LNPRYNDRYIQHCTAYSAPARVKFWEAHEAMQLSIVRAVLSGSSVWKIRPCALSLGHFLFEHASCQKKKKNIHPARVVRPARRETNEFWEDRCTTASAPASASTTIDRRKIRTSVVVYVQAERSATILRAIPRTCHVAVTSGRRGAIATDCGTAVLRTKGLIRYFKRWDRSAYSTRLNIPLQKRDNPRQSRR
jgi:hypothetical protein